MGLFKRRSDDPGELERLRTGLGELRDRLEQVDAEKVALGSKVRTLVDRLERPITAPPPEPPVARAAADARAAVDPAEIEAIRGQIARLTVRLEALDRRVTTVSTELANQLGELSGDIEALGKRAEADAIDEAMLAELRDAQTRLANEQARYQIAFRQDLAEIADHLRRA